MLKVFQYCITLLFLKNQSFAISKDCHIGIVESWQFLNLRSFKYSSIIIRATCNGKKCSYGSKVIPSRVAPFKEGLTPKLFY